MKLLDLDNNTAIRLAEDQTSFAFMSEAGTGRVVKGVNTTPDVGVNEIPRQAAKFKIRVNRDGYPPVARSDGKIPKLESADINEANKWLKAGAVAAALAGAGMGSAARAQDTTSTNVAIQSQAQLVDPTFMGKNSPVLVVNRDKWLATNPRPYQIEDYNEMIDFFNRSVPVSGNNGRKTAIIGTIKWLADPRNAGRGFNESKR
jgi:hypothetical protein